MDYHAQATHFRQMYPVLKAALASHSPRLVCLRLSCPLEISQDVFSYQFPHLQELELRIDGIKSLSNQSTLIREAVVPFLLKLRANLSALTLDVVASEESFPQASLLHQLVSNLDYYPKLTKFSITVSELELSQDSSGLDAFFSMHTPNLSSFSFHISSSPDFRWRDAQSQESPISIFNHLLPSLTILSFDIPALCLQRLKFPNTPSPHSPTNFGYPHYVASHLRNLVELSLQGYYLTPDDFSSIFSTPSAAPHLRKLSICLLHFDSSIAKVLEKAAPQLQKLSLTFLSFIYFPTKHVSRFFLRSWRWLMSLSAYDIP